MKILSLKLWEPSPESKQAKNMTRFIETINSKYLVQITSYEELYTWSLENTSSLWAELWKFAEIKASQNYDHVVENYEQMMSARWFTGAKLNFAENLLRFRDNKTALIFKGEGQESVRMTYAMLYDQVARLAKSLRSLGVTQGDRVAGFMPNMPETVIAMLATTSIGAVWSSCSPDFGIKGVVDRFGQIKPKVLFSADGYFYNGKAFDSLERILQISSDLCDLVKVVIVPNIEKEPDFRKIPNAILYNHFLAADENLEIEFTQVPFNHPTYIMYSSGTTGVPKCIVHGAGGTLIQHLKELMLHTDLKREDTILYFTTCGWMMWNWMISSLAIGATVVLYDGSPFYPEAGALWQLIQDEKITVFGTSAKYLSSVEQCGLHPGESYNLMSLKTILSTGSPLSEKSFQFVYQHIKQDICLSSISGGTDIISCFALGNPIGAVYAGEIQCRGLGMKVESYNSQGQSLLKEKGELVCTAPFPSMPICFWNDADQAKYYKAYFNVYPNVWRHGDFIEITETGGVIIYGRSDATLNPGGVRIGTAEIYRQIESLPEVADCVVVGQHWNNDIRVILFIKLSEGIEVNNELENKIKATIKLNSTPRHVPSKIIAVKDIPYTLNGKKVEIAVANIIHNEPVLNLDALANPQSLELFKDLPELKV
ncbi:acetoacetate--CoA ligase [Desulfosporosinus acidiphilus]|uniref:acetoacetate--CoA ligase n=1 Tax=Desulfosporosinus acidiphilus TaxID=885581 RepID=UPI003D06C86F